MKSSPEKRTFGRAPPRGLSGHASGASPPPYKPGGAEIGFAATGLGFTETAHCCSGPVYWCLGQPVLLQHSTGWIYQGPASRKAQSNKYSTTEKVTNATREGEKRDGEVAHGGRGFLSLATPQNYAILIVPLCDGQKANIPQQINSGGAPSPASGFAACRHVATSPQ